MLVILDFDHQSEYLPNRWYKTYTISLEEDLNLRDVNYPDLESVLSEERLEWIFGRIQDASARPKIRHIGLW